MGRWVFVSSYSQSSGYIRIAAIETEAPTENMLW